MKENKNDFKPYIPADQVVPEFTVTALILGILLAVIMGVCVYFVGFVPFPTIITLLAQVAVGALVYIGVSAVLKLEEYEYLLGMVKSFIKK